MLKIWAQTSNCESLHVLVGAFLFCVFHFSSVVQICDHSGSQGAVWCGTRSWLLFNDESGCSCSLLLYSPASPALVPVWKQRSVLLVWWFLVNVLKWWTEESLQSPVFEPQQSTTLTFCNQVSREQKSTLKQQQLVKHGETHGNHNLQKWTSSHIQTWTWWLRT